MAVKIFVFKRTQQEEVIAGSEEEARRVFVDQEDWSLEDVREVRG